MAIRLFFFLLGFGLSVIGGVSCIMYLNLLAAGLTMEEYFAYIAGRTECYFLVAGVFLLTFSTLIPSKR
ncbi:hypothetical protein JOC78_000472 [Bacillus ectoiniformans]|uniref:hypothetical protein n=1 Tax=Bacillus ectoiniformans TaxID=1494429 RepID=UPI00195E8399|nr:hypothetical protein [Bacillus ectoiniformans]MBM7647551.1 hypothetical protein [Bacillus ectoiniformans]